MIGGWSNNLVAESFLPTRSLKNPVWVNEESGCISCEVVFVLPGGDEIREAAMLNLNTGAYCPQDPKGDGFSCPGGVQDMILQLGEHEVDLFSDADDILLSNEALRDVQVKMFGSPLPLNRSIVTNGVVIEVDRGRVKSLRFGNTSAPGVEVALAQMLNCLVDQKMVDLDDPRLIEVLAEVNEVEPEAMEGGSSGK